MGFFLTRSFKPKASRVLKSYLLNKKSSGVISFAILKKEVLNDQFGQSKFNLDVNGENFCIFRTGCHPFLKYHCVKTAYVDTKVENIFFNFLKCINLGLIS